MLTNIKKEEKATILIITAIEQNIEKMTDDERITAIQNNITVAKAALDAANSLLTYLIQQKEYPKPLYYAIAKMNLLVRDAYGNTTDKTIIAGEKFPVYEENKTVVNFTNRLIIAPNGMNIWMGHPLGASFQKL